jgi:excisionase family DNA binding protein
MDTMTVQEASAVLGVEGSVIRRRLIAGTMKGIKVNARLWLIPKREVEKWRRREPLKRGRRPLPDSGQA